MQLHPKVALPYLSSSQRFEARFKSPTRLYWPSIATSGACTISFGQAVPPVVGVATQDEHNAQHHPGAYHALTQRLT